MNKNTSVALIEYNTDYNLIEKVYEIYDINYAPLSVFNASKDKSKNLAKEINNWFRNRGIPSWIKEQKSSVKWKDINFFENDFQYKGYLQASLSNSSEEKVSKMELMSPNNTTDGMLQKGWIIENKKRILVKGTYQASREEPINEWLASEICSRLGFKHCKYEIDVVNDNLVSNCEDFINEDEEIISVYDIYFSEKKANDINDYEHYIKVLEKNNVPDARKNVENMFILDYLIMNIDRHLKNFGAIRNVNTLEWKSVTPIFDNGESMQSEKITNNIDFYNGTGKFFSNTNKDYEDILKCVKDIKRIDIKALDGIVEEYKKTLENYKIYTDSSEERIEKLCEGLKIRIELLRKHIEKNMLQIIHL